MDLRLGTKEKEPALRSNAYFNSCVVRNNKTPTKCMPACALTIVKCADARSYVTQFWVNLISPQCPAVQFATYVSNMNSSHSGPVVKSVDLKLRGSGCEAWTRIFIWVGEIWLLTMVNNHETIAQVFSSYHSPNVLISTSWSRHRPNSQPLIAHADTVDATSTHACSGQWKNNQNLVPTIPQNCEWLRTLPTHMFGSALLKVSALPTAWRAIRASVRFFFDFALLPRCEGRFSIIKSRREDRQIDQLMQALSSTRKKSDWCWWNIRMIRWK